MTPNNTRDRLKEFLYKETNLVDKIFDTLASQKIAAFEARRKRDTPLSEQEKERFIADNFTELNKDAEKTVDRLCKELLPESQFWHLAKQFGVISVFLIPPFLPLSEYLATLWAACPRDWTAIGACIAGMVFPAILIIASGFAIFRDALTRKKPKS